MRLWLVEWLRLLLARLLVIQHKQLLTDWLIIIAALFHLTRPSSSLQVCQSLRHLVAGSVRGPVWRSVHGNQPTSDNIV